MDPSHLWPISPESADDRFLLDYLKVGVSRVISRQAAESLSVHRQDSVDTANDLILGLKTYVLAEKLPPEKVTGTKALYIEMPATWWQYFKFQYEPAWWMRRFVKRYPVRWIGRKFFFSMDVSLQKYRTFPKAKIPFPIDDLGMPVNKTVVYPGTIRRAWDEQG